MPCHRFDFTSSRIWKMKPVNRTKALRVGSGSTQTTQKLKNPGWTGLDQIGLTGDPDPYSPLAGSLKPVKDFHCLAVCNSVWVKL